VANYTKGHPKAGGRQKGTPNKRTQDLMEKCVQFGVDPFEVLLDIARNSDKEENRAMAAKELCQYIYPKRKAIEITGSIDHKIASRMDELRAMSPEKLEAARLKALKLVGKSGS
jgi:hypothetical protein